ncbi:hypothetical protein EI94DRAFT_1774685 [Lactarius quietus]|nr:hypothetical protein EI94DRAFT_1774685 [Lactarius quietus]
MFRHMFWTFKATRKNSGVGSQWNKHIVVYLSNTGLPCEMLDKEFCTKFVMLSPTASPMELMHGVWDLMDKALDSPVATFDCKTRKEILIIPYLIFTASDNPMHAKQTSSAGLNANYFCHTCDVGGTKAYKKSNEGFAKIFEVSILTKQMIKQQLELCVLPGGSDKVESASHSCGIKDVIVVPILSYITTMGKSLIPMQQQKVTMIKGSHLPTLPRPRQGMNLLIGMPGFNMHQDTPTEILHTVLLSVVKYFWAQTIWYLKPSGKSMDFPLGLKTRSKSISLFQTQLAFTNWNGLNVPSTSADYICQYNRSLIGKHFKSLAQVMPFLIYDLVPQNVLHAWNIIGTLAILLWHTKIDDTEVYLVSSSTISFSW